MSATKKSQRAEQKRAEMEALHQQLTDGVESLRTSGQWARYLAFCASFHRYSFSNVMLIFMQCPEASGVAGYRAWQAKGRQVRKGEKAIRIMGTGTVKRAQEEDVEGSEETDDDGAGARRRVFFPVSVFDLSQTDVVEGYEDSSTLTAQLDGEDEADLLGRVVAYLTTCGVAVSFEDLQGRRNGYAAPADPSTNTPVRVVIEQANTSVQQAKTALHEAAHVLLGHLEEIGTDRVHRGRLEVEAESVAYVAAGLFGLDTSAYSTGYVAGWCDADPEILRESAGRVLTVVHTLAEAIEGHDKPQAA